MILQKLSPELLIARTSYILLNFSKHEQPLAAQFTLNNPTKGLELPTTCHFHSFFF